MDGRKVAWQESPGTDAIPTTGFQRLPARLLGGGNAMVEGPLLSVSGHSRRTVELTVSVAKQSTGLISDAGALVQTIPCKPAL
jgi:hypothetical protein